MAVFGALSRVVTVVERRERGQDRSHLAWRPHRPGPLSDVNADLLFKRLWIDGSDAAALHHLRTVAAACAIPQAVLDALNARRRAAAQGLAAATPGHAAVAVELRPLWRLVIGHGEDTAHETSLTMSPTYGVPIIPGSALKGVTAAQARADHPGGLPPDVVRLFGTPRPGGGDEAARGSVRVLDALPTSQPRVVVDVLTPHVKQYYDGAANGHPTQPPAEYYNPVPVHFLAVHQTPFLTWLIGPAGDVDRLATLLETAVDDLGIGGKTAAGYGYCQARRQAP